ncbi:bL12 family ribosomal protein [Oscillatoria salina]|uniref:bL12 family ribosomal protein n=1 Tax=Oscillatoria salina TaxID=331517 RepID=UPI001CCCCD5F|nr:bL12 family ribosomal protein [Oscillatoria salina]
MRQDEQIARLEKKFDLLLKELGVEKEIRAKTEYEVILELVPADKKIAVLKAVRLLTDMGLKEAKDLVESTPAVIKRKVSGYEAEKIATKLRNAGATVSIH